MSGSLIGFEATPPEILPIFPLPGVLLLPRGHLPLAVFEPRYLHMTLDALGNGRIIGMVQTKRPESQPVPDDAPVYATGCAGRITQFSETDDGRLLITLTGVTRFRIVQELERLRGYRRVKADFREFTRDMAESAAVIADRERLLDAVRAYFQVKGLDTDWEAVEKADDEMLLTSLAMTCPFAPEEKQALLESDGPAKQAELLTALMEMAACEGDTPPNSARH